MVTPMTTGFKQNDAVYQDLLERIPMGRGADPKEIGRCVLFLASDDASFVTGQGVLFL